MAKAFRNRWPIVIIRTPILAVIFVMGCLSIVYTQAVGNWVFRNHAGEKQSVINLTKTHFLILLTYITSWVTPSKISITYDKNTLCDTDYFKVDSDGNLMSSMKPNSLMISNHQIYTDWLYLWFLSHTARLSDAIFIVLKDLSNIPVLGYGMKNFNFLFLSRKWEKDKVVLSNQLLTIDANARGVGPANGVRHVSSAKISENYNGIKHWPQGKNPSQVWPYQVIFYPEGTVVSEKTRSRSVNYAKENDLPQLRHVLWPRVRGLLLLLKKLNKTTEIVYDITTNYSDLKAGECGEDTFSLKRFYLLGYGPRVINYHIRGWRLEDIPLGEDVEDVDKVSEEDLKKFEAWLFKVWVEKDQLMDIFFKTGNFLTEDEQKSGRYHSVEGDLKLKNQVSAIFPFVSIFCLFLILRWIWLLVRHVAKF